MPSPLPPRFRLAAAILASLLAVGVSAATAASPAQLRAPALTGAAAPSSGQAALRASLGAVGVVGVDPVTGTPRFVAELDGFLTEPSTADPADVVLRYVREHSEVFRLDEDDLAGLRLVRDETDAAGAHHLLWAQTAGGIPAFANDLRATVTRDGRLLTVGGSPVADLELPTDASVGASTAVATALRAAGRTVAASPRATAAPRGRALATRFAGGHDAALVLVTDEGGTRLAWRVTASADSDEVYTTLVDARNGDVLASANKVTEVGGNAWDYYPGAASGGTQAWHDFTALGWLPANAQTLNGNNARVYSDWNDSNTVQSSTEWGSEETDPTDLPTGFPFDDFTHANGFCAPTPPYVSTCSWDSFDDDHFPQTPGWYANRRQNAVQVFYLVNTFHDHLKNDPDIAWTTHAFEGTGEKVVANAEDGADTGTGGQFLGTDMPDQDHVNNANMFTPPYGSSLDPRMQMYLFTSLTGSFGTDPTPDVNGGDDASVVYHEYAHGLSSRLITYSDGWSALDAFQSGAMGEGWSDWYALDYLVAKGYAPNTGANGDVTLDRYVGNGKHTLRTEGLDCPVGAGAPACPGGGTAGAGGYTLGDMGKVCSCGPEVHADGEIWAQTLWDLRTAVGVSDARFLVTEAMRLAPTNPSFLEMRDAMLAANQVGVGDGRANRESQIWQVFATRGMGYFATTSGPNDMTPAESFALPPDPGDGFGSVAGTVTDADSGQPLAGVHVQFDGPGFSDTTDAAGHYALANVPVTTYPTLTASKAGFHWETDEDVTVVANTESPVDFQTRRDWAAHDGGGRVSSFTGPDFTAFGCGPGQAIDHFLGVGWSSQTGAARSLTVKLPSFVDVTELAVDPGAVCGDPDNASTRDYRIEVSKTGASGSWATVRTGTFTLGQAHQLNSLPITKRTGVRYVRFTMLSNQGNASWIDLAELEVYGVARPGCLGLPATRIGTNGANTITGSSGADVIVGLGGNDTIKAGGGNDVICGGDGKDSLTGGKGVDRFDAGSGNDTLVTRDKKKETTIRGGSGTDRAHRDGTDKVSSVEKRF
ncbi:MAG TPA: M36 family metallopeptidase [Gaiellaceae bacterium]|nr:M36 family metallopeptidase [Gaiellaceae bacterium]